MSEFVSDLVGAANSLNVSSEPIDAASARVTLPGGATVDVRRGNPAGDGGRLILRPDRIAVAPADAAGDLPPARIAGTVRQRLYQGSHFEYVVMIEGATAVRVFARGDSRGNACAVGYRRDRLRPDRQPGSVARGQQECP